MPAFTIDHTAPNIYLDKAGKVVNGFQVTVTLTDYNETHLITVPDLNPTVVKTEIDKLIQNRNALANLGSES